MFATLFLPFCLKSDKKIYYMIQLYIILGKLKKMIGDLLFETFLGDSFSEKIEYSKEKCLRETSERNKCEKCAKICPEEAITLEKRCISISQFDCTGCNLCVSNCYSGALKSTKKPYLEIMNDIVDKKAVDLTCKKRKIKDCINVGCIRTMDFRFLYALMFSNLPFVINVDLSSCETCEYGKIKSDIDILKNADFGGRFSGKIIDTVHVETEELMSRREFFESIFSDSKEFSKAQIREVSKKYGFEFDESEDVDKLVKVLLKRGLKENSDTEFMKEYIFTPAVDRNCDFCNECVSACPKKALEIKSDKNISVLMFSPEKCNFCGRCIERCRKNSISKSNFKDFKKEVLFLKKVKQCKICKTYTTELNEEGLCKTCEKRKFTR
jgi:ferredoxin